MFGDVWVKPPSVSEGGCVLVNQMIEDAKINFIFHMIKLPQGHWTVSLVRVTYQLEMDHAPHHSR